MIRIHPTKRKAIKEKMAEDYHRMGVSRSYFAVGEFWEVSGGMAYKLINEPDYFPKDNRILKILRRKAEEFNL